MMEDIQEIMKKIWPEWKITEKIGEGAFATVYKAVRQDLIGTSYAAIKMTKIPRDSNEIEELHAEGLKPSETYAYYQDVVKDYSAEIKLMDSVKGYTNIVAIDDYRIYQPENEMAWYIFIRMELLTPLVKYVALHGMGEKEIIRLGTDLCTALDVCRQYNIVHRDIKPENIFVNNNGYFKLGDFGVARNLERITNGLSRKGTPNYMAPEVYKSIMKEMDFVSASKVDIYSLGMVMYWLGNGSKLPFVPTEKQLASSDDRKNAFIRRINGEPLPPPRRVSPELQQIILKACSYEADERYESADEMRTALLRLQLNMQAQGGEPREKSEPVPAVPRKSETTGAYRSRPEEPETASAPEKHAAPDRRKKSRWLLLLPACLLIIGLVFLGIHLGRNQNGLEGNPPVAVLTEEPTEEPAAAPTEELIVVLTEEPAVAPTEEPTPRPTEVPTASPTEEPAVTPTEEPTEAPTEEALLIPDIPDSTLQPYQTPGSIVTFGHYEQDNNQQNGLEPIEWIVLDVRDGKSLLLSRYGLDAMPYNLAYSDTNWKVCTLREWLNNEFIQSAFSEEEQSAMLTTDVDNGASIGLTQDRCYLLSDREAEWYLKGKDYLKPAATAYAVAQGAMAEEDLCFWWLRTLRFTEHAKDAAAVNSYGDLDTRSVSSAYCLVRPVIWIDPESGLFTDETYLSSSSANLDCDETVLHLMSFGYYEQDGNPVNGREAVEWIVLDEQDGKYLLLSSSILDIQAYGINEEGADGTDWETSAVRAWLNSNFINEAFTPEEQSAILVTEVDNSPAQNAGTLNKSGGNNTQDKIFLLSYAEFEKYLSKTMLKSRAAAVSTAYVDQMLGNSFTDWWLRSPGEPQKTIMCVGLNGSLGLGSTGGQIMGVRPVLWMDINQ